MSNNSFVWVAKRRLLQLQSAQLFLIEEEVSFM